MKMAGFALLLALLTACSNNTLLGEHTGTTFSVSGEIGAVIKG